VQNYASAFLPAIYQGTAIGTADVPVKDASIPYLANETLSPVMQRRQLDLIQHLNHAHLQRSEDDAQVEGMVQSYELAFRMQSAAPSVLELAGESEATRKLYGIGTPETDDFGSNRLQKYVRSYAACWGRDNEQVRNWSLLTFSWCRYALRRGQ
jgi:hypothetical protein